MKVKYKFSDSYQKKLVVSDKLEKLNVNRSGSVLPTFGKGLYTLQSGKMRIQKHKIEHLNFIGIFVFSEHYLLVFFMHLLREFLSLSKKMCGRQSF